MISYGPLYIRTHKLIIGHLLIVVSSGKHGRHIWIIILASASVVNHHKIQVKFEKGDILTELWPFLVLDFV